MLISVLLVALGSGIGALARLLFMQLTKIVYAFTFPLSTFLINVLGAFLLGYISVLTLPVSWKTFIETGMLASFTTFSTLQLDLAQLYEAKKTFLMVIYGLITYVGGILFFLLGIWSGS